MVSAVRGRYRLASISLLTLLALTGLVVAPALAQSPPTERGAELVETIVPFVFDGDLRSLPTAPGWRPGDPIKEIPRRYIPRPGDTSATPAPRTPGPDPLLALQEAVPEGRALSAPTLNFDGQGFSGVNPPDTVGDVGIDHYIQMINASGGAVFTVYSKATGAVVAGPTFLDTLGSGFCASGLGDPVVLFDPLAGRWLLSEFSASGNRLCVYVSQTSDPVTGGWYNYDFSATNFPDYPKYGVWPDAYFVTTNESSPAIYALERSQMLTGGPADVQRFTAPDLGGFGFQALTPADLDGPAPPAGTPAYLVRHNDDESHSPGSNDPGQDFIEIFEFDVDFANAANSSFTGPFQIGISEFDSNLCGLFSFNCISQPGTTTTLDPLREVVMWRAVYRNFGSHQALIGSFATDVSGTDRSGVRWFELERTTGSWSLFQEGTYSPDSDSRWMSSIVMDDAGNLAIGYNVSSSSTFPGLRYAGREMADPAGTLPQGEQTLIAGTASNASNRYGDYSSLNLDPVDGCTIWFTGEYNSSSQWSTRIGSFSFPSCSATCGNNVIEPGEVCDGTDLGGATCGDQGCSGGGTLACNTACTGYDTSLCLDCAVCDNDGICEPGEDCANCANDCAEVPQVAVCGNGVCEAGNGEDCLSCPADCNGQQKGKPSNRFCCGDGDGQNPLTCSDSLCSTGGFECTNVPTGTICCSGEEVCGDGVDNNCNGVADCDDVACSLDPICQAPACSSFGDRKSCNAEAGCSWDNRNKVCVGQ